MNQIAASFRIAGIIIATTTKVHSLASFGENNAMSLAYCNSTLVSEKFGNHASWDVFHAQAKRNCKRTYI